MAPPRSSLNSPAPPRYGETAHPTYCPKPERQELWNHPLTHRRIMGCCRGLTETLEQRIRRLEDALASLQDTHSVEQHAVLSRVSERLERRSVVPHHCAGPVLLKCGH